MGRVMGIDYGTKRTGVATTDPLQIIVSGLPTVDTLILESFLLEYLAKEQVDKLVFGKPSHKDGTETYIMPNIDILAKKLQMHFPTLIIDFQDENYTSMEAQKVIMASGIKKKKRQDKTLVDKVSAILILQKYLRHI